MTEVVPAIIPETYDDIISYVRRVKGIVSRVQIDILDGEYVAQKTWPYNDPGLHFESLTTEDEGMPFWEDVNYEFDLMITRPEDVIEAYARIGAQAVIIHYGSTTMHQGIFKSLKEMGVSCGLAYVPSDDLEEIDDHIHEIDFIQLMGSDTIGEHGITLDERVFAHIRTLRERYPGCNIAVDIGVNQETAPQLVQAGATKLVSGSAIFESGSIKEVIDTLQRTT